MKKLLLLPAFILSGYGSLLAQHLHDKCATPRVVEHIHQQHAGYKQSYNSLFEAFRQYKESAQRASNDSIYYINTVVHIVYNTPEQNLHDSVILNQLQVLNDDFARLNADTVNLRSDFDIVKGKDTKIRFALATMAPNGALTNGITRTSTTTATFFSLFGGGLAESVKSTASGGIDPWDPSKYLNIWVCNMSIPLLGPSILGYAVPPPNLPNWPGNATGGLIDGVVIQFQCFGANNPNTLSIGGQTVPIKGRTPVHELGHYLGLRHIWGDANNCDPNETDGIDDTPNATGASQGCDPSANSCTDAIQGVDLPDMIENFMDYSNETCQNSFTHEQCEFMRWVLLTYRPGIAATSPPSSLANFNKPKASFQLFPNPSNGEFGIKTQGLDVPSSLSVYNSTGQLLQQQWFNQSAQVVLSDCPSGIYFVEVIAKDEVMRQRIVISH
jgi:hypothetical protein